mmetsp:Transcript_20159/g.34727  ORF Transcript_20159/g.34727 Transcript_20159/m.34727 type:complete len:204 (+) Transcript_20159:901-1512(+)
MPVVVDDWQLALLALPKDLVRFVETACFRCRDQIFRHDVLQWDGPILDKINISTGDHPEQLAAHAAVLGDWHSSETKFEFDVVDVTDSVLRAEGDWIQDETVLEPLDLSYEPTLLLYCVIIVNDPDSSLASHRNSHFRLGDCVHGGANNGRCERNALGELRFQRYIKCAEIYVTRKHNNVIIGIPGSPTRAEKLISRHAVGEF